MAKNLDFVLLLDVYGKMLTDKQKDVMELYYWEDLSLGEIAQCSKITRQAVRDSVKRSEQILGEFEEKLGLAEKIVKCREYFNTIAVYAENMQNGSSNETDNILSLALDGRELF
jgi:predicted DNA-binding protein YlxM (UPF0122 family)